ncbi:PRC-barrel domain-containing protein [Pelagibacterium sp. 26DY04]|uniref:PRC-barrel domain-containing protein n=1 Tax=Pelagibacterium sp. 26DY04 TaxID=2967130 RepID=UPI0028154498|nr:PRC-barrel domain-containing protein [Pelagibacterium sp. 26DY04]WMT85875.1 PRC-barrel domain-containing protein [Pelagibacterium sp. 26DY04]
MYRKLLASTALALVVTGGAYAQEMAPADPAMAPADPMMETPAAAPAEAPEQELVTAEETGINADGWLATEIIGETIYNSTGDDAEAIGDVNDFVLDQNGEIGAVVVGVGGFLGIGQKNVAINWDELELAQDMDGNNRLVAAMTREQLEAAAEFNREEWLASESNNADAAAPAGDAMAPAAPAGDAMAPAAPAGDAMAPAAPAGDAMAPAEEAPADDAAATEEAPADDAAATEEAPADDAAAAEEAPADDAIATEEAPADDAADAAAAGAAGGAAAGAAAAAATEEAPADDAAATEEAPADDAAATEEAPADDAAAAPAMDFDSFEQVAAADISADELTGTAVYGAGDEEIGSIGDILLSEDGQVEAVIIDFGGFLGIGTKPVAVSFDNLSFLRDENGGLLLRTSLTAEQLEAAPEYNEEAYTTSPEENTLIVE